MKLRIHGNSLRLRVARSEVERLMRAGRIEEAICFGSAEDAKLIYALECVAGQKQISVRWRPQEVTVMLPPEEARAWSEGDAVGLYANCNVGGTKLAIQVEKDFACLDGSDADTKDRFANPKQGTAC
jgi:hypothetical protein